MSDLDRVATLLTAEAPEKQVAAAIVLAELGARTAAVQKGLAAMLGSDIPAVQRHALDALTALGVGKSLERVFALADSRDDEVRAAATRALASLGQRIIPEVKRHLDQAGPRAHQALDSVLAQLGGKEAFSALLQSLHSCAEESAKAVALEVRRRLKESDAKTKKTYLGQLQKFLGQKATLANPVAAATGMKILGFLEDPKAVPTLLAVATDRERERSVRQEALGALRFSGAAKEHEGKLIQALIKIAEGDDTELARTALYTLVSRDLPESVLKAFARLVSHSDLERARFAIEFLGQQDSDAALSVLVSVLLTQDRARAELASEALRKIEGVAPLLIDAFAEATDPDRIAIIQRTLRPHAKSIDAAGRERLLTRAVERLAAGREGWEAPLQMVREASPAAAAEGLRNLVAKLEKGKKTDAAMMVARVLCRTEQATNDDRFRLAVLELAQGRTDTHPAARARDAALKTLAQLLRDGFDVSAALSREKGLDLETRYYVGFHFVEEGHPLGEDLLQAVAKTGAKSKVGKMAKNKLALAEREA